MEEQSCMSMRELCETKFQTVCSSKLSLMSHHPYSQHKQRWKHQPVPVCTPCTSSMDPAAAATSTGAGTELSSHCQREPGGQAGNKPPALPSLPNPPQGLPREWEQGSKRVISLFDVISNTAMCTLTRMYRSLRSLMDELMAGKL